MLQSEARMSDGLRIISPSLQGHSSRTRHLSSLLDTKSPLVFQSLINSRREPIVNFKLSTELNPPQFNLSLSKYCIIEESTLQNSSLVNQS